MTERLDLGSKLREPLQDWQFTPAMQQRVLERIKEEPARPVSRRSGPSLKTLAWTAAAAAVFVIGVKVAPFGAVGERAGQEKMEAMGSMAAPAASAQESMPPAMAAAPDAEMKTMAARVQAEEPGAAAIGMMAMAPSGQELPLPAQVGRFEPLGEARQVSVLSYTSVPTGRHMKAADAAKADTTTQNVDGRPTAPLSDESFVRWDAASVEAFRSEDESHIWALHVPEGYAAQTVAAHEGRLAILATHDAGAAIWVVDGSAAVLYEATFGEQITNLAFTTEGHLAITLANNQMGLIQMDP